MELNARERVLKLFGREKIDRVPVFSGMGNVTVHGLEKHGWEFSYADMCAMHRWGGPQYRPGCHKKTQLDRVRTRKLAELMTRSFIEK